MKAAIIVFALLLAGLNVYQYNVNRTQRSVIEFMVSTPGCIDRVFDRFAKPSAGQVPSGVGTEN